MAAGNWISMTWNGEVQIWLFINFHLFFSLKSTSSFLDSSASFKPVINTPSLQDDRYLVCSRATSGFTLPFHKGRYTREILLPEHTPGSFCTCQYTRGSVFKFAQFAPWACSQIFNRLNIVEHFAGWKFCFRGWSIPMKSLIHKGELCSRSVPLEYAPGAKSLECIGLNRYFWSVGNFVFHKYENQKTIFQYFGFHPAVTSFLAVCYTWIALFKFEFLIVWILGGGNWKQKVKTTNWPFSIFSFWFSKYWRMMFNFTFLGNKNWKFRL